MSDFRRELVLRRFAWFVESSDSDVLTERYVELRSSEIERSDSQAFDLRMIFEDGVVSVVYLVHFVSRSDRTEVCRMVLRVRTVGDYESLLRLLGFVE